MSTRGLYGFSSRLSALSRKERVISRCKSFGERLFGGRRLERRTAFSLNTHGSPSSIWRKALPVSSSPIHQKVGRAYLVDICDSHLLDENGKLVKYQNVN